MSNRRGGFTIVEVLVAVVISSIGIISLAGSAGGVTRMMYLGQRKTRSYTVAASALDSLRNRANSTSPKCSAALATGSGTNPGGFAKAWTITGSGSSRQARVIVSYPSGRRTQADTLYATLLC
jgi:prepilin-type N-terminal cleavage/methylation domain-containing protein